jgi:hypothetical protein
MVNGSIGPERGRLELLWKTYAILFVQIGSNDFRCTKKQMRVQVTAAESLNRELGLDDGNGRRKSGARVRHTTHGWAFEKLYRVA